jgi:NADH dehydrogenase (ubiquinone) 1 alpha subcomplex subunit 9
MSLAKHFSHVKWHNGRSSNSGITATVFGANGFLGRYVVNRLARSGARIVVPYRGDDYDIKHLRVMGDLGQIVPFEMSIRDYAALETAIAGSNVVINLLGKPFETRRFSFDQINVAFPRVVGALCAELGVDRLVHFSALGASPTAASKWLRTKALGELAVREEFPGATILRPGTRQRASERARKESARAHDGAHGGD